MGTCVAWILGMSYNMCGYSVGFLLLCATTGNGGGLSKQHALI